MIIIISKRNATVQRVLLISPTHYKYVQKIFHVPRNREFHSSLAICGIFSVTNDRLLWRIVRISVDKQTDSGCCGLNWLIYDFCLLWMFSSFGRWPKLKLVMSADWL